MTLCLYYCRVGICAPFPLLFSCSDWDWCALCFCCSRAYGRRGPHCFCCTLVRTDAPLSLLLSCWDGRPLCFYCSRTGSSVPSVSTALVLGRASSLFLLFSYWVRCPLCFYCCRAEPDRVASRFRSVSCWACCLCVSGAALLALQVTVFFLVSLVG